jgi:hypothetical protein
MSSFASADSPARRGALARRVVHDPRDVQLMRA